MDDSNRPEQRSKFKDQLGQPQYILQKMAEYMQSGDVDSITDLIGIYIAHSTKYKNQEQFAEAIGTTRQTLHRLLTHHETVSLKVFSNAIEMIRQDSNEMRGNTT